MDSNAQCTGSSRVEAVKNVEELQIAQRWNNMINAFEVEKREFHPRRNNQPEIIISIN